MTDKVYELVKAEMVVVGEILPQSIKPSRFQQLIIAKIKSSPELMAIAEKNPQSIRNSMNQAAQLGLELNSPLGQCSLVPRAGVCTLSLDYKGMIELVRNSPKVKNFYAHSVYKDDKFEYRLGVKKDLDHVPSQKPKYDRDITGVYAVCQMMNGGVEFEYMTRAQVNEIMTLSPSHKNPASPWKVHFGQMARKTCIKRLFSYLPKAMLPPEAFDIMREEDEALFPKDAPTLEAEQPAPNPLDAGRHEKQKPIEPTVVVEPTHGVTPEPTVVVDTPEENCIAWFEKQGVSRAMLLVHRGKSETDVLGPEDIIFLRSNRQRILDSLNGKVEKA